MTNEKLYNKLWDDINGNILDRLMIESGARFEMMNWVHYDEFEYEKFAKLFLEEIVTKLESYD